MLQIFKKYEEVGLTYYAKDDESKRNLTHPKNESVLTSIDDSESKWINPVRESYYWIKNENSDA